MTPFYNDNANRAFPFLAASTAPLPEEAVVDFGCELGNDSGFVPGESSVWLSRVSRVGTAYRFVYRSDAPGLRDKTLEFEFDLSDPEYTSDRAEAGVGSSGSDFGRCVGPGWSGFMAIGKLDALPIADGESLELAPDASPVEPSVVWYWHDAGLESVSLYNRSRTAVPEVVNCSSERAEAPTLYLNRACLTGDVRFKAGYNCSLQQNASDNSLTFGAGVGSGAGPACREVPLFDEETEGSGSSDSGYLDGSPGCSEVLRSINGVGGRVLAVQAGRGVSVYPGPSDGQLVVDIHLGGLAVCRNSSSL